MAREMIPRHSPARQSKPHERIPTMTHERLTLADELDAAMIDAPELCAQCGTPLTDSESR